MDETGSLERRRGGAQAQVQKVSIRDGQCLGVTAEAKWPIAPAISVEAFQEGSVPIYGEMPVTLRSVGAAGGALLPEFPGISAT